MQMGLSATTPMWAILMIALACKPLEVTKASAQGALREAQAALRSSDQTRLNVNLDLLRAAHYAFTEPDVALIAGINPQNLRLLTTENSVYLATSSSFQLAGRPCICGLYRTAIEGQFRTHSIVQILRDSDSYTSTQTLLRRSIQQCEDPRSKLLSSVLAVGKSVGFTSLTLSEPDALSRLDPATRTLEGIARWLRNDYEAALQEFQDAKDAGDDFGMLEPGSVFLEHYRVLGGQAEVRHALDSAEAEVRDLSEDLALTIKERNELLMSILAPGFADVVLHGLEGAKEKKVATAARTIGTVLTLVEISRLADRARRVPKLRRTLASSGAEVSRLRGKVTAAREALEDGELVPHAPLPVLEDLTSSLLIHSDRGTDLLLRACV